MLVQGPALRTFAIKFSNPLLLWSSVELKLQADLWLGLRTENGTGGTVHTYKCTWNENISNIQFKALVMLCKCSCLVLGLIELSQGRLQGMNQTHSVYGC